MWEKSKVFGLIFYFKKDALQLLLLELSVAGKKNQEWPNLFLKESFFFLIKICEKEVLASAINYNYAVFPRTLHPCNLPPPSNPNQQR